MKLHLFMATLFLAAATVTSATAAVAPTETVTFYLSGHDKDDAVPWQFSCNAGQRANTPSTIPVPSNWELQNFGIFSYGVEHRGTKAKPVAPPTTVQGHYTTTFIPPSDFAARRNFLVFEGVMTDTQATLNGQSVGPKHQGGYFRFKYDVTSLLKPGQPNTLDVIVDDESANASVNNAERRGDYFNYGGIYRPVYLESVPHQFINRVAIDAKADGSFSLNAFIEGPPAGNADTVKAQIFTRDGTPVGAPFSSPLNPATGETAETRPSENTLLSANLKSQISNPLLWTAETPNLYTVQLSLMRGTGTLHSITQRFGFRTIEVRNGDGLYVNGTRILLKGCDRHTFWPDSGRCTSEKISRADIALMHEMNMNAVRMSHYPPDQHFLDAADDMGLYVLDELPGWHGNYDDEIGHKVVNEMVTRDINHPCILFWDNGNESGWNTKLDPDFPAIDPQKRHVLHPWALNDHVDTKHYPDYKTLVAKANGENVFFPTEMIHGLYDGGAGASLADYWDVIRSGKVSDGGFIWAFLDEAPKRVDAGGFLDTRGNLAPDGIVGPYREKEASFYTIKEIWSPVVITDKEVPANGQFHIENRYNFINLKDCKFSYQLRKFPSPGEDKTGFTVLDEAKLPSPDIAPGASGTLKIDSILPIFVMSAVKPSVKNLPDAIAIRIENPAGQELFTRVFALASHPTYANLDTHPPSDGPIGSEEFADTLTARYLSLALKFDRSTGLLKSVDNSAAHFSLTNGPRLVTGDAKLSSLTAKPENGGLTVTALYSGDLKTATWHIRDNGWIDLDATYNLTGPQNFIGLGFDYPEKNIKSLKWLGDGPYRVYKNRTAGPTLGVWQNDYNDSVTGSIPWKYPEFKGYFANVRWAQYQTTEGPITFLIHTDNLFLQNFTPTQPDKKLALKTLVPYPTTSIAFLNAIPAIGTKFSNPADEGPNSQQPIATGDYHTQISIYFGELPK